MRIVVIGGGIAGLTAAYRIRRNAPLGTEVLLLEAGSRPGGHALTVRERGFLVEAGPNGFLDRASEPEPMALVRDLKLEPSLIEARASSRRRFIVHGGRLRRVPDAPATLIASDALSLRGKLRLLAEPFVPRGAALQVGHAAAALQMVNAALPGAEESVYEFSCRRIGREAAEVLVDTAVSGISAGDSRALSVAAAFPLMTEMERDHGSLIRAMIARRQRPPRLVTFAGGMSEATDALARELGEAVRTGAQVRRLARAGSSWRIELEGGEPLMADRIVLASPASRAAAIVAAIDSELSATLASFPYAGLAVAAFAFRNSDLPRPLDGYGYLVTRSEGLDTLGVVWDSSLFPGRAPDGMALLRVMLGGARRPEVADLDEAELVRRAFAELERVLGIAAAPERTWLWRWPAAIAQYTRGHLARVARARTLAALHPGLELCGSSYDGIAFGASITSGVAAAARVLNGHEASARAGAPTESAGRAARELTVAVEPGIA